MECPTCFRKLVVPQAPAPGTTNFVLAAAEAQKRTIPLPQKTSAASSESQPKQRPVAAVIIGVLVCGAAIASVAYFVHGKNVQRHATDENQTNAATGLIGLTSSASIAALPAATSTNWTLDLNKATIPDAPTSGALNGFSFNLERATIQEGKLDLRQGAKWPPDVGVSIHLLAKRTEDIAGKTVLIEPDRTSAPRVVLRWKDEQGKAVTRDFKTGYAVRLEFGQVNGKWLPGKIFIATPDDAHSYAAGTFNAEIRKPAQPKKQP